MSHFKYHVYKKDPKYGDEMYVGEFKNSTAVSLHCALGKRAIRDIIDGTKVNP